MLFEHSLKEIEDDRVESLDHIFSVEPVKINSPFMDSEVALALRVLEGFDDYVINLRSSSTRCMLGCLNLDNVGLSLALWKAA
ncbi:hypothetical protein CRYUN_Cryun14cG0064900 [Craigia yunnanensis]